MELLQTGFEPGHFPAVGSWAGMEMVWTLQPRRRLVSVRRLAHARVADADHHRAPHASCVPGRAIRVGDERSRQHQLSLCPPARKLMRRRRANGERVGIHVIRSIEGERP